MKRKAWFCEECHVEMEEHGDFAKCPLCGAEVWREGEGSYDRDRRAAELAEKIHGKWFCQRCRIEMKAIDGDFAKCPECGAEVWFGKAPKDVDDLTRDEIKELMQDFTRNHMQEPYAAMIGGRPAHGGGGGRSGKSKDKRAAMKKPTCEQLYHRLCNSD